MPPVVRFPSVGRPFSGRFLRLKNRICKPLIINRIEMNFQKLSFCPAKAILLHVERRPIEVRKVSYCRAKGVLLQSERTPFARQRHFFPLSHPVHLAILGSLLNAYCSTVNHSFSTIKAQEEKIPVVLLPPRRTLLRRNSRLWHRHRH